MKLERHLTIALTHEGVALFDKDNQVGTLVLDDHLWYVTLFDDLIPPGFHTMESAEYFAVALYIEHCWLHGAQGETLQ